MMCWLWIWMEILNFLDILFLEYDEKIVYFNGLVGYIFEIWRKFWGIFKIWLYGIVIVFLSIIKLYNKVFDNIYVYVLMGFYFFGYYL